MKKTLILGDCIQKMKELPENSVDSVITDPPYGLGFMGHEWDTYDKNFYGFSLTWAKEAMRVLKPGGFLYLAEFHPLAQAVDEQETGANGSLAIHYPMIGKSAPRQWHTETDYADEETKLTHTGTWEWNHGVGELLSSLIGAGLRIDYFKEHPYLTWRAFAAMVEIDEYFFGLPDHLPAVPLAISLKAVKV